MIKKPTSHLYLIFLSFILCLLSSNVSANSFLNTIKKQDLSSIQKTIDSLAPHERKDILETRFNNKDTPLIFAARESNLPLFNLLVKAGASPNARDRYGRDIINIAIRERNSALVEHALAAGTDPKAFTKRYRGSTLIFASHQGEVAIVNMLINAGAPLDRINNLGWTALLEATILGSGEKNHQAIVKALLEAGADQTITDNEGLTPFDHATSRGHDDMATILSRFKEKH